MKALAILAVLAIGGLLGGCNPPGTSPSGSLPTVPADIQACFRKAAVTIPDRALSVADVESLWKQDRIRLVAMRNCGNRFLAWYSDLQRDWK